MLPAVLSVTAVSFTHLDVYKRQIQRSLTIKFNNDAEFNATRCAVIYNDGDCDDFIVSNLLETFWKNLDIPDGIAPENYADDFWKYDLEFEIGNCIVYSENGEFESSYELSLIHI